MTVVPLKWKDGEGFDIHLLRKGPPSKALDASFDLDPQATQIPVLFTPHFKGAPSGDTFSGQGVTVKTKTGEVTAAAAPAAPAPKLRNFLMTASQNLGQGDTAETVIRFHLHDSIQKIWLTPATLTIHGSSAADNYRFTVLALFDDGAVGDITDWPQLKLTSADDTIVTVAPDGSSLQVSPDHPNTAIDRSVDITVTLSLPATATPLTATAQALTQLSWADLAPTFSVEFVDGPVRPNFGNGDPTDPINGPDLGTTNKDSIPNVANARTNILFISEGFSKDQKKDFEKLVENLVKTGLPTDLLQPFKLLKGSINYWRLFVPSHDDGISILGECQLGGAKPNRIIGRPDEPATGPWSLEGMMFEVGLPVPNDPQSLNAWLTQWNQLYDAQVLNDAHATQALVSGSFKEWSDLRNRSPLNERDTIFGFAIGVRARASDTEDSDAELQPAPRRMSEATIDATISRLQIPAGTVGNPAINPFIIGDLWAKGNKDRNLVCFICLSDLSAGEQRPGFGYFAATTGTVRGRSTKTGTAPTTVTARRGPIQLSPSTNGGTDIKTTAVSKPKAPFSPAIFASLVAHECGHALGLGDEYGPGNGTFFSSAGFAQAVAFPNLQSKDIVVTSSGASTTYHPDRIKWLLPRAIKLAVMTAAPVNQGGSFQIPLMPGQGSQFAAGDIVLMRQPPVGNDPFKPFRFTVVQSFPNAVDVTQNAGSAPLDLRQFDKNKVHVLICATVKGVELGLVAPPILNYIGAQGGPLNADPAKPDTCDPFQNMSDVMSPRNAPPLKFKKVAPAQTADVVGIYEGGGHFDCGVFRPAGRCKMRTTDDQTIPFCQVCQYLIVDRVDATKLQALDAKYDPNYPV
jgi:hypothetical protein